MLCVLYAIFTAISRITDHKHHPTDVMAGAVLGSVLAAATVHRILVACGTAIPPHRRNNNDNNNRKLVVEHVNVGGLHVHSRNTDATDALVKDVLLPDA
jgi:hypothetical protein